MDCQPPKLKVCPESYAELSQGFVQLRCPHNTFPIIYLRVRHPEVQSAD